MRQLLRNIAYVGTAPSLFLRPLMMLFSVIGWLPGVFLVVKLFLAWRLSVTSSFGKVFGFLWQLPMLILGVGWVAAPVVILRHWRWGRTAIRIRAVLLGSSPGYVGGVAFHLAIVLFWCAIAISAWALLIPFDFALLFLHDLLIVLEGLTIFIDWRFFRHELVAVIGLGFRIFLGLPLTIAYDFMRPSAVPEPVELLSVPVLITVLYNTGAVIVFELASLVRSIVRGDFATRRLKIWQPVISQGSESAVVHCSDLHLTASASVTTVEGAKSPNMVWTNLARELCD